MPLRITILSGDRQGQQLEFDQDVIEIGDRSSDDVGFEVATNPGIRQRRATLKWHDGGWTVNRSGEMPIFLNQDLVQDSADIKSGDFLRMSHDGPDLSCEFISRLAPVAKIVSGASAGSVETGTSADAVEPTANASPHPTSIASSTTQTSSSATTPEPTQSHPASQAEASTAAPHGRNSTAMVIMAIAAVLLVAVPLGILLLPENSVASATTSPAFVPFGVIVVEEGEQVFWRPTLTQSDPDDLFSLGEDAPDGMTIDESTGTIRWQTSEEDGPGEFRCQIMVKRGPDATQTVEDWLEIKVDEVNQSPVLQSIPAQTVNLLESRELKVSLAATDADVPAQPLRFRLGPDAPEGVQLDAETGELTWQVADDFANQLCMIPFIVSDGQSAMDAQGVLRVRVSKPDRWSLAEQKLRESVYLVVTETKPGKLIVPLGTACAIGKNTLLTSASVAHGINDARGREWTIYAVDTRDFDLNEPKGIGIQKVQTHAAYLEAQSIADPQQRGIQQAFFDLALLTTEDPLPVSCQIGDLEASVKNNQTVAFYGFGIEGGSLSNFDSLEPTFEKVNVLAVVPPPIEAPIQGRPPFLLQLVGKLPFQPFGSLIVDEQGKLLAIYVFEGQLPDGVDSDPIHYAVDSVHAVAYLNQQGLDLWVDSPPIRPDLESP